MNMDEAEVSCVLRLVDEADGDGMYGQAVWHLKGAGGLQESGNSELLRSRSRLRRRRTFGCLPARGRNRNHEKQLRDLHVAHLRSICRAEVSPRLSTPPAPG